MELKSIADVHINSLAVLFKDCACFTTKSWAMVIQDTFFLVIPRPGHDSYYEFCPVPTTSKVENIHDTLFPE